jgi:hypothetical protein
MSDLLYKIACIFFIKTAAEIKRSAGSSNINYQNVFDTTNSAVASLLARYLHF